MSNTRPRIGLALSGGGYRATAFGLGALRALHDRNVLRDVTVVSGISGGSILAAMWAYGPTHFDDFDNTVTELLTHNLQLELLRRALNPTALAVNTKSTLAATIGRPFGGKRTSSRTEALVAAIAARDFGKRHMTEVTHPGLTTVISATDLGTGNAVRFGSQVSAVSPIGTITNPVPVCDAVAASAAFPVGLPQLIRTYDFATDPPHQRPLHMADGGIYDNLGITPLLPNRSRRHTRHVYDLDYLIVVDAGQGWKSRDPASFMGGRLKRAFDITYRKAQDGNRALLNKAAEAGDIDGFIHPYLPTFDENLPAWSADLVPRSAVAGYPTNLATMTPTALQTVTTRGEQLTRMLIETYNPTLGRG